MRFQIWINEGGNLEDREEQEGNTSLDFAEGPQFSGERRQ